MARHLVLYGVLILWLGSMRLSSAEAAVDRALRAAVADALHLAGLSMKEAAAIMQTDEANFRNRMHGRNGLHLSLNQLALLPWEFWFRFAPSLIYVITRRHLSEVADDLGIRRSA